MLTNSPTAYGTITKTFHWSIALLILALIPLGIIANQLPFDTNEALAQKAFLFSIHKTLGIVVFVLAVFRILWAMTQTKPVPIHPDRRAETYLAHLVHWLLYGSLVLVPLTGWIHHASTEGFAPIWLPIGQNLPFVPESARLAEIAAALHIIFERVLAASILLHVAGALKHAVLDRDGTLARMWFGARQAGHPGATAHAPAAPIVAIGIWCAAIGIGAGLGLFAHHEAEADSATLAEVASRWEVQDGTLSIEVTQLGSPVSGSFADWTAVIYFSPETGTGTTEVTIAIGSLTLGTVTGQALGPDYLDGSAHPTAHFVADIAPDAETGAFLATGTLSIKGNEIPVTLPFEMTIDGDTATMSGQMQVDRRDFEVGLAMEEGNLGFGVDIRVSLTAQQRPSE